MLFQTTYTRENSPGIRAVARSPTTRVLHQTQYALEPARDVSGPRIDRRPTEGHVDVGLPQGCDHRLVVHLCGDLDAQLGLASDGASHEGERGGMRVEHVDPQRTAAQSHRRRDGVDCLDCLVRVR